jgi:hypothetical protein
METFVSLFFHFFHFFHFLEGFLFPLSIYSKIRRVNFLIVVIGTWVSLKTAHGAEWWIVALIIAFVFYSQVFWNMCFIMFLKILFCIETFFALIIITLVGVSKLTGCVCRSIVSFEARSLVYINGGWMEKFFYLTKELVIAIGKWALVKITHNMGS